MPSGGRRHDRKIGWGLHSRPRSCPLQETPRKWCRKEECSLTPTSPRLGPSGPAPPSPSTAQRAQRRDSGRGRLVRDSSPAAQILPHQLPVWHKRTQVNVLLRTLQVSTTTVSKGGRTLHYSWTHPLRIDLTSLCVIWLWQTRRFQPLLVATTTTVNVYVCVSAAAGSCLNVTQGSITKTEERTHRPPCELSISSDEQLRCLLLGGF